MRPGVRGEHACRCACVRVHPSKAPHRAARQLPELTQGVVIFILGSSQSVDREKVQPSRASPGKLAPAGTLTPELTAFCLWGACSKLALQRSPRTDTAMGQRPHRPGTEGSWSTPASSPPGLPLLSRLCPRGEMDCVPLSEWQHFPNFPMSSQ